MISCIGLGYLPSNDDPDKNKCKIYQCLICGKEDTYNNSLAHVLHFHSDILAKNLEKHIPYLNNDDTYAQGIYSKLQFDSLIKAPTRPYQLDHYSFGNICAPILIDLASDSEESDNEYGHFEEDLPESQALRWQNLHLSEMRGSSPAKLFQNSKIPISHNNPPNSFSTNLSPSLQSKLSSNPISADPAFNLIRERLHSSMLELQPNFKPPPDFSIRVHFMDYINPPLTEFARRYSPLQGDDSIKQNTPDQAREEVKKLVRDQELINDIYMQYQIYLQQEEEQQMPNLAEELAIEEEKMRLSEKKKSKPKFVPFFSTLPQAQAKEAIHLIVSSLIQEFVSEKILSITKPILTRRKKEEAKKIREKKEAEIKEAKRKKQEEMKKKKEMKIAEVADIVSRSILRQFIRSSFDEAFKEITSNHAFLLSLSDHPGMKLYNRLQKEPHDNANINEMNGETIPTIIVAGFVSRRHLNRDFVLNQFRGLTFQMDKSGKPKIRFRMREKHYEILLFLADMDSVHAALRMNGYIIDNVSMRISIDKENTEKIKKVLFTDQEVVSLIENDNFSGNRGFQFASQECPYMIL